MIARNNFYSKLDFLLLCTLWRQNAKWISKKKVQQIILGLARLVSVYLGGQGYRLYPRFFILFRTFENYYFKCVQTCGTNHTSHPAALSPKITILYEKNLKKKTCKRFFKNQISSEKWVQISDESGHLVFFSAFAHRRNLHAVEALCTTLQRTFNIWFFISFLSRVSIGLCTTLQRTFRIWLSFSLFFIANFGI